MAIDPVSAWRAAGEIIPFEGNDIFVLDRPATSEEAEPLLVLHGFPSASFDWRHILDDLALDRRVLLLDFLGFGLSSKPDRRYGMRLQADVVETVMRAKGLTEVALLTHDMGDTVGGELLRRDLEGTLPFSVTRRVITNGSIYIEMAHLTPGQQMLLSLPDEALPEELLPEQFRENYQNGLAQVFAHATQPDDEELAAQWALAAHEDGYRMMPRLIRYIEERRAEERRFTGAIEEHPSPLTIVWADLDPVAVYPMATTLVEARPDATLITLEGIGHYPMIEAPEQFAAAARRGLSTT